MPARRASGLPGTHIQPPDHAVAPPNTGSFSTTITFPQIELATVERSQTRLVTALRNGVLDALIVTDGIPKLDNKSLPLWSERILVALPHDHALTERECLYWTDLRQETVLLSQYDPGREFEQLLVSKLISRKIVRRSRVTTSVAELSRVWSA
jgi:DNA-binding transcriptional LysR family regulator